MNPLNSIRGGIIAGVVLAIVVVLIVPGSGFNELSLARWIHIIAGVMWVGLLYYVVVAQVPGLAAAAADKGGPGGAGITKYVAPRVLLWFRENSAEGRGSALRSSSIPSWTPSRTTTRIGSLQTAHG